MVFPADTCFWTGWVNGLKLSSAGILVALFSAQAIQSGICMRVFHRFSHERDYKCFFFLLSNRNTIISITLSRLYTAWSGKWIIWIITDSKSFYLYFYLPLRQRSSGVRRCSINALPEMTSRWRAVVGLKTNSPKKSFRISGGSVNKRAAVTFSVTKHVFNVRNVRIFCVLFFLVSQMPSVSWKSGSECEFIRCLCEMEIALENEAGETPLILLTTEISRRLCEKGNFGAACWVKAVAVLGVDIVFGRDKFFSLLIKTRSFPALICLHLRFKDWGD